VEKQNVTLSLPSSLMKKFRVLAAKRDTSMSQLMEGAILKMVQDEDDYDVRAKRMIESMKNSTVRGPGDNIPWTRDEIYDRVR